MLKETGVAKICYGGIVVTGENANFDRPSISFAILRYLNFNRTGPDFKFVAAGT